MTRQTAASPDRERRTSNYHSPWPTTVIERAKATATQHRLSLTEFVLRVIHHAYATDTIARAIATALPQDDRAATRSYVHMPWPKSLYIRLKVTAVENSLDLGEATTRVLNYAFTSGGILAAIANPLPATRPTREEVDAAPAA